MLDCLKFLLSCTIQLINKLFQIDVGFTNLGTLFCIIYILFPAMLIVITSIKHQIFAEMIDDYEDNSRSKEKISHKKRRY